MLLEEEIPKAKARPGTWLGGIPRKVFNGRNEFVFEVTSGVSLELQTYQLREANSGFGPDWLVVPPPKDSTTDEIAYRVAVSPAASWSDSYVLEPGHAYLLEADDGSRPTNAGVVTPKGPRTVPLHLVDITEHIRTGELSYTGIGHSDGAEVLSQPGAYGDRIHLFGKIYVADMLGFQADSSTVSAKNSNLLVGTAGLGAGVFWRYWGPAAEFEFGLGGPTHAHAKSGTTASIDGQQGKPYFTIGASALINLTPFAGRVPVWGFGRVGFHYWEITLPNTGGIGSITPKVSGVAPHLGGGIAAYVGRLAVVSAEYRRDLGLSTNMFILGVGVATDTPLRPSILDP